MSAKCGHDTEWLILHNIQWLDLDTGKVNEALHNNQVASWMSAKCRHYTEWLILHNIQWLDLDTGKVNEALHNNQVASWMSAKCRHYAQPIVHCLPLADVEATQSLALR